MLLLSFATGAVQVAAAQDVGDVMITSVVACWQASADMHSWRRGPCGQVTCYRLRNIMHRTRGETDSAAAYIAAPTQSVDMVRTSCCLQVL